MKRFNTAGPCRLGEHYALPTARRMPSVLSLIERKTYFVLHAPRQVGKTTSLMHLAQDLTASGGYVAALISMEVGAPFRKDPGLAEGAILGGWRLDAKAFLPPDLQPPPWPAAEPGQRLRTALEAWAQAAPRPLVVFLDEIDALQDDSLISVLRQLRSGYGARPRGFPWSMALVGLRDVRDYRVEEGRGGRLGTASPFNIKEESITLRDFTEGEVAELYAQHTAETGQAFTAGALRLAFELTQGQPWLVNALARQAVEVVNPDLAQPVTEAHLERAKEILILRQDTHLDSLAERLREPRVRAIIGPMLAGEPLPDIPDDDLRFICDLGLVRGSESGGLVVSNPIYREVIPRVLGRTPRASLPQIAPTWLTGDGRLDTGALLEAFLEFWREHGEALLGSAPYQEIAPHLVLMAFLHRVVNGGGSLIREYALGKKSMDLCLRYGEVTLAIELKTWRTKDKQNPIKKGLAQLDEYLSKLGLETGWLVLFDQRDGLPPIEERTSAEGAVTPKGRAVTLIRA